MHPCKASLRPPGVDLSYYTFAGRIVGKCILECALGTPQLTKARFTRSFLVQILGLKVTSQVNFCLSMKRCNKDEVIPSFIDNVGFTFGQCLKTDDPQMYNAITENSVEGLDLFFVDGDYDSKQRLKVCFIAFDARGRCRGFMLSLRGY